MDKNIDFESLSKIGLSPIYAKVDAMKCKLAYQFCMALLSSVDNWKNHYERTKNWFDAPLYARWKLEDIDKKVYFWKVVADNIKKRPSEFFEEFPEEYHCYTEENYTKLCEWVDKKDEKIIFVDDSYDDSYNNDPESATMYSLSHGYGDEIGYD